MFERYTDRARRVVVLAQEEARLLHHNYIGGEHIALGLIHEREGVAAQALESLGVTLDEVRKRVEKLAPKGEQPPSGHIPFTPRAKKMLELALREALQLGHAYIGTEHILLGLLREGEGIGTQALAEAGATPKETRDEVLRILSGKGNDDRKPEVRHNFRIAYEKLADGHEFDLEPGWTILSVQPLPSSKKVFLLLGRSA